MIAGKLNALGTIASGVGFSANKASTGTYDITFNVAMSTAPIVVVTAAQLTLIQPQISNETVNGFRVTTSLLATLLVVDGAFTFIAVAT